MSVPDSYGHLLQRCTASRIVFLCYLRETMML